MSIPQSGGGPIEHFGQLVEYMEAGSKPPSDWRIGTEHEKFGFHTNDLSPLPYEGPAGVRAVLEGMMTRFGWQPVLEGENVIALKPPADVAGGTISLEPGGQLELSGAPLETIHETAAETAEHLDRPDGHPGRNRGN